MFALCLALSSPVLADSWYVLSQYDKSVSLVYAPPNSTGGGEAFPSLDAALAAVGAEQRISGVNLGYVLNSDLLGMQESIRSTMASSYPTEYGTLLLSASTPVAWKAESLCAKLRVAILKSSVVAEITSSLEKLCLEVSGVDLEKETVALRLGVPHFTAFVWLKLEKCSSRVQGAAQQPHAASGEIDKVHAPDRPAGIGISDSAPQGRRAVADAGRWAPRTLCMAE